ncbi:MAG: hypothetical protein K0S66_305 [Sphingomonas sp.]|jgi:hypothetical protein|nr:hypothetical protein [Sphingomonas sp.]
MKHVLTSVAAAVTAMVLPSTAVAQTACLSAAEAEAITAVAFPDIILETGRVCTTLPASSIIRRTSGPFLTRYQAEADRAWPAAQQAIAKLSDPRVSLLLLQSDYARPLITSLIAPMVVGQIQQTDCGTIDRIVTLLEPLPARNTAGIVVATLQHLKAEKARGAASVANIPDLPVCAAARR